MKQIYKLIVKVNGAWNNTPTLLRSASQFAALANGRAASRTNYNNNNNSHSDDEPDDITEAALVVFDVQIDC